MCPSDYFSSKRLNRRDTFRLFGSLAGVGAVALREGPGNLLPSGTLMAAELPKGGIIRTALKDVPPQPVASCHQAYSPVITDSSQALDKAAH